MMRHTYKVYEVNEDLKFKRKLGRERPFNYADNDMACKRRYFMIPDGIYLDSLRLKELANKIYRKTHRRYLWSNVNRYDVQTSNDSLVSINYHVRVIHGYDFMTLHKKKSIITVGHGYTGKF